MFETELKSAKIFADLTPVYFQTDHPPRNLLSLHVVV